MKKIIAMLLALVMVFALAACGKTAPAAANEAPAQEAAPAEEAAEPAAEPAAEAKTVKAGFIFLHDENSSHVSTLRMLPSRNLRAFAYMFS